MSKPSREKVIARTDDMERLYIACKRFSQIASHVAQKQTEAGSPWFLEVGQTPLCRRQLYYYLEKAKKRVSKRLERNRNVRLDRHFARRLDMYSRALDANDVKTALAVADSEAKLEGLFPPADASAMEELWEAFRAFCASQAGGEAVPFGNGGLAGPPPPPA